MADKLASKSAAAAVRRVGNDGVDARVRERRFQQKVVSGGDDAKAFAAKDPRQLTRWTVGRIPNMQTAPPQIRHHCLRDPRRSFVDVVRLASVSAGALAHCSTGLKNSPR